MSHKTQTKRKQPLVIAHAKLKEKYFKKFPSKIKMKWNIRNQLSHCKAALIFCTVQEMRLLTVSTDSTVSFAVGRLFTKI